MQYGYAYQLGERAGGFDPDAKAYITAIETAGATVTSTQKKAINTFYKTGKSDGWYSSIKRLYLPIWASAAPNAVDMVTRASGTFNGTVTHSAGYVQGDGTSGYFNCGTTGDAVGQTNEDFHWWHANITSPTSSNKMFFGAIDGASFVIHGSYVSGTPGVRVTRFTSAREGYVLPTLANRVGIFLTSRDSGDDYTNHRISSGATNIIDSTVAATGSVPSTRNYYAMSLNNNGSPLVPNATRMIGWGFGLAMSKANGESFTLAFKNLWETSTGLTLP